MRRSGHHHVEQHEAEAFPRKNLEGSLATIGFDDLVVPALSAASEHDAVVEDVAGQENPAGRIRFGLCSIGTRSAFLSSLLSGILRPGRQPDRRAAAL